MAPLRPSTTNIGRPPSCAVSSVQGAELAIERIRQGDACVAALRDDPAVAGAWQVLAYAALERECPVDGLHAWWHHLDRPHLLPLVHSKLMRWFEVEDLGCGEWRLRHRDQIPGTRDHRDPSRLRPDYPGVLLAQMVPV